MSLWEKGNELPENVDQPVDSDSHDPVLDLNLDEALRNFKLSVDAWCEAAYNNRRVVQAVPRRNWRPAAAWALGCALVVSSVSGGVYQRHERQIEAKQAAARLVEQQKQVAVSQAVDDQDLLASVDNDVSQQVPSAMEPLAQMSEDDSK